MPKRLGSMTLAELQNTATELKIEYLSNASKGQLALLIRSGTRSADEQVVCFGRLQDLHVQGGAGVVPGVGAKGGHLEVKANPGASDDLKMLAAWSENKKGSVAYHHADHEENAVTPYVPDDASSSTFFSGWKVAESLAPPAKGLHDWNPNSKGYNKFADQMPKKPGTNKSQTSR